MANTRNNPLEDLAMHLPMICDRYELRDDVMPGAGRSRGGIGVVKAQRVLTDAFITHENERHHDVPWGIFGGGPGARRQGRHLQRGAAGRREAHAGEVFRPARRRRRRARVLRPCGGGFGDPLERPAEKVLDDVLDGFCTVEHARAAYGVDLDPVAETVDAAATGAFRERLRSTPQPPAAAAEAPRAAPATAGPAGAVGPSRPARSARRHARRRRRSRSPHAKGTRSRRCCAACAKPTATPGASRSCATAPTAVRSRSSGNCAPMARPSVKARSAAGGQGRSLGELLERAANDSLQKCVDTLLRNGRWAIHRGLGERSGSLGTKRRQSSSRPWSLSLSSACWPS